MPSPAATFASSLVLFFSLATPAASGNNEWTSGGPFGGDVEALAVDPEDPDVVYAGTWLGGLFKSTDAGATWFPASDGLASSALALAIDPEDPATLYAGTFDGVYKTSDGAATWTRVAALPADAVLALALDPADPITVYVGLGSEGVYKSTDAGDTWTAANQGMEDMEGLVYALAVDPRDPGVVYAGTGDGLYRTGDGAATWTPLDGGWSEWASATALAIDPASGTVYAGLTDNVYHSEDRGATWTASETPLYDVRAFVLEPESPDTVYAGHGDGIKKSKDAGRTWTAVWSLGGFTDDAMSLAIDPQRPGTVYCGTYIGGVMKSTDAGATWNVLPEGFLATWVSALAVDPADPDTVYTGLREGGGLFRSRDGGQTWSRADAGLGPTEVDALLIDPADPATLYAGTWTGVYRSTDRGDSWVPRSDGLPGFAEVHALARDPSRPQTLYAGAYDGVWKTVNAGRGWTSLGPAVPVYALALDESRPTRLHAGTEDGVMRTTDGGATWHHRSNGLPAGRVEVLAIDPSRPNVLFAGTWTGLYRTSDGGASWTRAGGGLPWTNVESLAIDPFQSDRLYAGTYLHGVYKSLDGGSTWRRLGTIPPGVAVDELAVAPSDPYRVYAGTRGGGVQAMTQVLARLGNRVWLDTDADGLQDGDELGAPGVTVELYDARGTRVASAVTDPQGFYVFDHLDPGRYSLLFVIPPGFLLSPQSQGENDEFDSDPDPATGRTAAVVLDEGARDASWDAGLVLPPEPVVLELHDGRFEVRVEWKDFKGHRGLGYVASLDGPGPVELRSEDSAVVEFFGGRNWELLLKILDGRRINDRFWVFYAAATNVGYTTAVTDTSCGVTRTYTNPLGVAAPAVTDVQAFPGCQDPAPPSCVPSEGVLCLGQGGRFRVEIAWSDFGGTTGIGRQVVLPAAGLTQSRDSGLFYYFNDANWELLVKVLDGCSLNGHFWVFSCATTNVEYTFTVTDRRTGVVRTYSNPLRNSADATNDTRAFATCEP